MSQDRSVLDEVAARLSAQQFLLEIVLAQAMRQMNFEVRRRFTDDILQVIQRTNTPTVKDELYAAAVADITGRMRELIAHIIRRAEDRVNSLAGE